MTITRRGMSSHFIVHQTSPDVLVISALTTVKNTVSCVLHANLCLPTCGAGTHSVVNLVLNASALPIQYSLSDLHYIPRYLNFRPHQVINFIRTFDALVRNNLYALSNDAQLHITFLFAHFICSMLSNNSPFFSSINTYIWLLANLTDVVDGFLQCLFLFSSVCVYQLTPTL